MFYNQDTMTSYVTSKEINHDIDKILFSKKGYAVSMKEINEDIEQALHSNVQKKKKHCTLNDEINQDIERALRGNKIKKAAEVKHEKDEPKIDVWEM